MHTDVRFGIGSGLVAAALLVLLGIGSSTALAIPIPGYALVSTAGAAVPQPLSLWYSPDLHSPPLTLIGATGVTATTLRAGLALSNSGTLYATIDNNLYTLNRSTGAATLVGDIGRSTGGLDYAHGRLVGGATAGGVSTVFSIDPVTAMPSDLVTVDGDVGVIDGLALADPHTAVVLAQDGAIHTVDLSTGTATAVAPGFSFAPLLGLDFGADGRLYAAQGNALYAVDTATGSYTLFSEVLSVHPVMFGLALSRRPVPAPGTLALVAVGALAGARAQRHARTRGRRGLRHR